MKEDDQKALKRLTFKGQDNENQKGPGNSDQPLFRFQDKFLKIPLLRMYYLTKFNNVL